MVAIATKAVGWDLKMIGVSFPGMERRGFSTYYVNLFSSIRKFSNTHIYCISLINYFWLPRINFLISTVLIILLIENLLLKKNNDVNSLVVDFITNLVIRKFLR